MEIFSWFMGALLGIFLYNLVSSVADLIFGPILGYKLASMSFFGLMLVNENGKMKFRETRISFVPSVQHQAMIAPKWKKIIMELCPIVVGAAAVVGVRYWAFHLEEVYRLVVEKSSIILAVFLIVHFIILINLIIKMFGKSPAAAFWREKDRVMTLLQSGIHPKDIEFRGEQLGFPAFGKDVMHQTYDLCLYYNALERNDQVKLKELVTKMENCLGNIWDDTQIPLLYELVYYYSAIENNLHKAEEYSNYIRSLLEKDGDVNGKRVYAAYLYYTNKPKRKALQVAKEGLRAAEKYEIKGIAMMERNILSELIEKIEGDIYEGIIN